LKVDIRCQHFNFSAIKGSARHGSLKTLCLK
jgi:hypothetical protein